MCLITDQKEPFIAKEDIPVYKFLVRRENGSLRRNFSPFYHYKFKHGSNTPNGRKDISLDFLEFHNIVNGGFLHAYVGRSIAKSSWFADTFMWFDRKIVKMYIPKGAEYYLSLDATEICSTELLWISPLERIVRWFKNN